MPPLNCWIIEDEPPALRRISRMVQEVRPGTEITFTADTVQATQRALRERTHPDLILSDIHLADGLCFSIWEASNCNCPIIFTTAYDQYSIRAFRVNSIDYLLKPIERAELDRALQKLEVLRHVHTPQTDWSQLAQIINRQEPVYRERFLAQHRQEWIPVKVSDLSQIYSEDGLTFALSNQQQRYLLDESLDRIEAELHPQQWFRINRSQLVHIDAIRKVSSYFNHRLALDLAPSTPGENIVSRPRVKAFKAWLVR